MIEGFQNPGLAIGAALCVVPLVIHLLNRQRHRPQPWAAMRFVLAAYKRTRRRVQLENLLLLLARMLAVAALAFAIARPFASGDSPLAGLREERRDLVLAIDGSASTGWRGEVASTFESILARAETLIGELDDSQGDRVRLVFVGDRPRVFPWTGAKDAISILETLIVPLDEGCNLAAAFDEIANAVEEDRDSGVSSAVDIRFLTDLQAQTFFPRRAVRLGAPGAAPNAAGPGITSEAGDSDAAVPAPPALAEQLARFDELELRVVVEDLGPRALRPDNLSVSSVEAIGETVRAGIPFDVAVEISNHGDQDVLAERVALQVDGERLPSKRIDIPGRGTAETVFTVVLDEPGHHSVVAALEGDRLAADDERALITLAPKPLRVLLVNGAPSERLEDDEIGYLSAALEPPDDALGGSADGPFEVTALRAPELDSPDSPIESSDVIVLANVPSVSMELAARLEARVAAGAALILTMGDRMGELSRWQTHLWKDDGSGLLPARLSRVVNAVRRTTYYRVSTFDGTHPSLAAFDDDRLRPLLTEVPVYDFVATSGAAPGSKVLARLDDAAASPLLLERPYGEGRVLLWTSSIDRAWNRVPDSGKTFILLTLELFQYAGTRAIEPRNVAVGETVSMVVDAFPRSAMLVLPTGGQLPVEGDPKQRSDGRWTLPLLDGSLLDRAGVYTVRADEMSPEPIAVRLNPGEGDLARSTASEVEAIHPALVVARTGDADAEEVDAGSGGPRQGELWRWLAMAAIAFLVFESLWGAYIGNRRRTP